MSDDESGSEKDSEEEEEEEEEEEGSSSTAVWDPKNSHASYYTYDKKKKTATYSYTGNYWCGTVVGKKNSKFAIKLGGNAMYCMVGLADPSKLNKSSYNYSSNNGHFYYPSGSSLYGSGSVGGFQSGDCNAGTVYGFNYDKKKGEIKVYKNGTLMGIAFKGIKGLKTLCPAVEGYYQNSTYEFVKPKFSKK